MAQVRTDNHWRNGGKAKPKKPKLPGVMKPARPKRGAPYLADLVSRG